MSVIGFREAEEHATAIELAPGFKIRVVTIPTLVMLKLVAHSDRRRSEDLADVLFILEQYSRYELEERIFDELTEQLAHGDLPFEQAGAFLLGRDVSLQCHPSNRPRIATILDDVLSHESLITGLVPNRLDEETWQKQIECATGLFRSFQNGFLRRR